LASILQLRFIDTAVGQPLFDGFSTSAYPIYQTAFDFGTRRYTLETAPSPLYVARHRGWQSWMVLAAGVQFSARDCWEHFLCLRPVTHIASKYLPTICAHGKLSWTPLLNKRHLFLFAVVPICDTGS